MLLSSRIFENRVTEYVKLHKTIESKLRVLKSTASPKKLAHHQHRLAEKIHEARHWVTQGIFLRLKSVRSSIA